MSSKNDYTVAVEENPDYSVWETVSDGLFNFNREKSGIKRTPPIAVIVRDHEQNRTLKAVCTVIAIGMCLT